MTVSRRTLMMGAVVAAPMLNFGMFQAHAASAKRYSRRVVDLVKSSLIIDMLAPLSLDFRPTFPAHRLTPELAQQFRDSQITGFHNAVGIGGPDAVQDTLGWFAQWTGFVGRNSDLFTLVDTAADLDRAKQDGKCAVIMGLQNADHFQTTADVEKFWLLGQRCSQLTYNSQNLLGAGGTDRVDGGVSDFGAEIIAAMNKQGMLVDVSHCGDKTTLDAIAVSPRPIAITHSNCRALVNHPRTKTDQAIKALTAKGGVMGITGVRMFVRDKEPTTIAHMVDHIDHVVKLSSIEHVGIGSDADLNGYDDMQPDQYKMLKAAYKSSYAFRDKIDTDGFDHPLKMFDLTEELLKRGYSDANVRLVLGGNFRRLLGDAWVPKAG